MGHAIEKNLSINIIIEFKCKAATSITQIAAISFILYRQPFPYRNDLYV